MLITFCSFSPVLSRNGTSRRAVSVFRTGIMRRNSENKVEYEGILMKETSSWGYTLGFVKTGHS